MDIRENKEMVWGGSGIEKCLFDFICCEIPKGTKILELGAGYVSTIALMDVYNLTSVEHNEKFIDINPNTIYAPIIDGWYDLQVLKLELTNDYQLIFLDGINREKFLENIELFKNIKKIIVHDTYRPMELGLSYLLAEKLNKKIEVFIVGDYWAYIY